MATKRLQQVVLLATVFAALQGCSGRSKEPYVFMLSDFMRVKELPYDSPTQVIYRIDDHRFVTLERYRDCNHGEAFYNDTRANIRQPLGRGSFENYQGYLINADPTGQNLAFPAAAPPHLASIDRGWTVELMYSTDGGRTFSSMDYMEHSFKPYEDSKNRAVFVTNDRLYVAKKWGDDDSYVMEYPLMPGVVLGKPYPPGVTGDSFALSSRPRTFMNLHTPSRQEHISCDPSMKPTNPDAPLAPQ
ncbi:T6SS immunity protein Tli3 family protein [Ralstonia holmesii]|uniref:Tli3-like domain-containing protein n=1 Tax=Ralstonia holmesii TaxID=3058602 RepID=A0ABC8QCW9_9RALS|nr:hypothetical protein [Ralstonia sp. LMG 32967]CAJ0793016.1 hypothetical protein LMG18096_02766 [Ralstonia sp. LMG 32967]CAJ0819469.1 hypothetical protein LMG18093_04043 [Ralstonia sp. LMG 32967]